MIFQSYLQEIVTQISQAREIARIYTVIATVVMVALTMLLALPASKILMLGAVVLAAGVIYYQTEQSALRKISFPESGIALLAEQMDDDRLLPVLLDLLKARGASKLGAETAAPSKSLSVTVAGQLFRLKPGYRVLFEERHLAYLRGVVKNGVRTTLLRKAAIYALGILEDENSEGLLAKIEDEKAVAALHHIREAKAWRNGFAAPNEMQEL